MNLQIFLVVVCLSVSLVFPGFEFFQNLAVRKGEIPRRGVHTFAGRPFLHWDGYAVQRYGDLIFLSLLNGFSAIAWRKVAPVNIRWLTLTVLLAVVITVLWLRGVKRRFASGEFWRWDWGFTAPDGHLTIAGKYHLIYFCFETAVLGTSILYLVWQPIGWLLRIGIIAPLVGYIATAVYDCLRLGLFMGPRSGTK